MQKMPDSRDVPPKNEGGLYRAGVAELQQHIIRMIMMSTKTQWLFQLKVGDGSLKARQVSPIEICVILLLRCSLVLFLDLFIYLNFEQKQHSIHHLRQFVDIYNCTVEISHQ